MRFSIPITTLLKPWWRLLSLQRQTSRTWHLNRLDEETVEYREAITPLEKLSEEADIFFAICRASNDGHHIGKHPPLTQSFRNALVYAYMVGKYSSRCAFHQTAAILCRAARWKEVRQVTNPSKAWKVRVVAVEYGICPDRFETVCRWLRWVWPLLP